MSTGSRSRSAPRSSPATGAPMSAATWSTTRCTTCRCWRRSRAPWTRRRRCGDGSSIPPSIRCAACWRPASGRAASATTSRPCACWKQRKKDRMRRRLARALLAHDQGDARVEPADAHPRASCPTPRLYAANDPNPNLSPSSLKHNEPRATDPLLRVQSNWR